jgi:hypothetical protein
MLWPQSGGRREEKRKMRRNEGSEEEAERDEKCPHWGLVPNADRHFPAIFFLN